MALLPSGLGWSADENYMKQYAGKIASINGMVGGIPVPVVLTPSDAITRGLHLAHTYSTSGTGYTRDWYLICDTPGLVVVFWSDSPGANYKTLYIDVCSTNSAAKAQLVNVRHENGQITVSQEKVIDRVHGQFYIPHDTPFSIQGRIDSPNSITFDSSLTVESTEVDALAGVSVISGDINKKNDGYAVVAWVKYKWSGGYGDVEQTPILISNIAAYTEFNGLPSGAVPHSTTLYYQGIIFQMTEIYNLKATTPFAILTLDYSGPQYGEMTERDLFLRIATSTSLTATETVDPYHDFPNSEPGGGIPNPNPQDDPISVDPLPTLSFASAGFCRIYNPELTDLQDLADYMWTDTTFLNTVINHLKQLIENPMDAVISLSIVPVVPQRESSKTGVNVMFIPTGVSMRRVTSQFQTVDCGTVFVEEKYGSALDYNPYTKVQIYLPYIGTVPLNTDEVMNKTLSLVYHIDVVTGICCAELSADDKLLYQFSGHCSVSQPINSADFSSYLNAAIAAAKVAIAATTGAAGAMAAAGASTTITPPPVPTNLLLPSSTELVPSRPLSDEMFNVATANIGEPEKGGPVKSIWGELIHPETFNTAASILGGKIDVQHSGGFSGNSGFLAKRRPYLIINRPQLVNPSQYSQFNGRPSMMYLNLGNCTGYTQVQAIHLTGISATESELSEIATLLKGGVVL